MAGGNLVEFTDASFQSEVLEASEPVLVDFWAEWCMPCRMLAPTIAEIAEEFEGRVKVGKVDTDKNRAVSTAYRINAIPTVVVFQNGEPSHRFVGVSQKGQLQDALNELLGAS